jgi:hypothetical protein
VYGQAVNFTVTVTGNNPTGTVQFYVDSVLFDTETLVSGMATSISTSTLAVGTHTVTATYSGDSNNSGNTGTLNGGQVVQTASAGIVVGSSVNPSSYGQSVTFTATISGDVHLLARGRQDPECGEQRAQRNLQANQHQLHDGNRFGVPPGVTSGHADNGHLSESNGKDEQSRRRHRDGELQRDLLQTDRERYLDGQHR